MTIPLLLWAFAVVCADPALPQNPPQADAAVLEQIRRDLLANPPAVDRQPKRESVLVRLDEVLSKPNSERSAEVAAHYHAMVDMALRQVADLRVSDGVVIWKLYSSSFLVKTPFAVFGIDLDEGPNSGSGGPDREAGLGGIALHLTDAQRSRLADLVDVAFHTHRHHDHIDYRITRELLNAGKRVVVPEDIRAMWSGEPFADRLTVLDTTAGNRHRFPGITVEVFACRQWMAQDHSASCPCNAWLITTDNGITLLTKGDINDGADILPWLREITARGITVDLYLGSLGYWWGEDAFAPIQRMLDPFLVPGHEYEFTHRKPGDAGAGTGSYESRLNQYRSDSERGKCVVLSWGERFHYLPGVHREAKAPVTWLELDPEPRRVRLPAGDSFTVWLNPSAGGVEIKRRYLSHKKLEALDTLPGFDKREWGGIIHDPDADGVFEVSTRGWPPGTCFLDCTVDDWPGGGHRATRSIEVTILATEEPE